MGLLVGHSSYFLQLQPSNAWKSLLEDQIYVNLWNKLISKREQMLKSHWNFNDIIDLFLAMRVFITAWHLH